LASGRSDPDHHPDRASLPLEVSRQNDHDPRQAVALFRLVNAEIQKS
jgi:hypothetical protein